MTLRERLESLSGNPTLVVSPRGSMTRDQMLAQTADKQPMGEGLHVGLCLSDPGAALATLAALDGVARSIVLVPTDGAPAFSRELASFAGLDAILCDAPGFPSAGNSAVPIFQDLNGLHRAVSPHTKPVETRWILATSGTTGRARLVSHTLTSLTRTTKIQETQNAAPIRWGLLYDHSRFAGLQVLLQSAVSGSLLIAPAPDADIQSRLALFSEFDCTHLSATPTLWRRILATPGASNLNLRQVTLGGEIADDRLLSALASLFPRARITHIFASTEAGVGFSVTDKRAGFPVRYLSKPPAGIDIKIEEERLFVRNPLVCPRYVNGEGHFATDEGWVDTGDLVEFKNDRVLFRGRANGVINVGGNKVHPEEVERALLDHPLVSGARVFGKSNPITGAVVVAEVVLKIASTNGAEIQKILRAHVRQKVATYKVPASIKLVTSLSIGAGGKLLRR